jgi:hypothetical protein
MHSTYALVHIAESAISLTLYGKGTRIDFVSYIAFKPRASPSNISGPMRLACEKMYQSHHFVRTKLKTSVFAQFKDNIYELRRDSFRTPIGLHKEGARVSIIALSGVNAATTNGPGPFDLRGLPFCKNPFPDWVIAQRRHCRGMRKQITGRQLG